MSNFRYKLCLLFSSHLVILLLFQILSMIEEAAGTRMYESKRASAQRTIEKKDSKLKEIEVVSLEGAGQSGCLFTDSCVVYVDS